MFARRAATFVALIASVSIIAGCAGSSSNNAKEFKGTEAEVADTINKLSTSMQKGQEDVICRTLLSPDTVKEIRAVQDRGCEAVLPSLLGPSDTKIEVTDVTVTGDNAVATVKLADPKDGESDQSSQLKLAKYQGVWKVELR